MFDLYRDRKPRTSILSKAIDALLGAVVAVLRPFTKRYHPELVNELDGRQRLSLGLRSADHRMDKKYLLDKENP